MMFIALLLASAMLASGSTPVMAEEPLDNQALRFVVKNESPIELRYRGIVEAGTLRPGDVVYIDPDGRKVFGIIGEVGADERRLRMFGDGAIALGENFIP